MESKKQQTSQTFEEEDILPLWFETTMREAGEMERYHRAGREALNLLKLQAAYAELPKLPFWQPLNEFLQKLAQTAGVSLDAVLQFSGIYSVARVTAESASRWALLLKKIGLKEPEALFQIRLDVTGLEPEGLSAFVPVRARGNSQSNDPKHYETILQEIESGYDENRYADLKKIHAAVKSAYHQ